MFEREVKSWPDLKYFLFCYKDSQLMMSLLPPLTIFCVCVVGATPCLAPAGPPVPHQPISSCSSAARCSVVWTRSFGCCLPFFFWGKEKTFHFKTCQCTICKVALPEAAGQHLSTPQPSHQSVSFVIPLDHLNT